MKGPDTFADIAPAKSRLGFKGALIAAIISAQTFLGIQAANASVNNPKDVPCLRAGIVKLDTPMYKKTGQLVTITGIVSDTVRTLKPSDVPIYRSIIVYDKTSGGLEEIPGEFNIDNPNIFSATEEFSGTDKYEVYGQAGEYNNPICDLSANGKDTDFESENPAQYSYLPMALKQ